MAKTTRFSTTVLVSLGMTWVALAGCNDANVPSQTIPERLLPGVAGTGNLAVAGAPNQNPKNSTAWMNAHQVCGSTTSGNLEIKKNAPCTEIDVQHCWRTCGPYNLGFKELTCSGAAYAENSNCNFDPSTDFSCFKIPDPEQVDPLCPKTEADAPRHGNLCDMDPCIVCGGNTYEQTSGYRDQGAGALKVGYCVCRPTTAADGTVTKKWACATMGTAWPCPNGLGC